jgi:hypothetical protein
MSKDWDTFERSYAEEREHSPRFSWGEPEPDCWHPIFGPNEDLSEVPESANWTTSLNEALCELVEAVRERQVEFVRLEALENRLQTFHEKLRTLENRCPTIVPIQTFTPEPFDLLKEIKVVVEESHEEFTASFYDANVASQGCTRQEAIDNLKDLLLSRFDYLDKIPSDRLGKSTKKQIDILREFIRRRD